MTGIYSNNKEEVRRAILRGMCTCAERIQEYHRWGVRLTDIHFLDGCPEAFKPSVSDKLLFNKIIDDVIDNIMSENRNYTKEYIIGASIMGRYYYPFYS